MLPAEIEILIVEDNPDDLELTLHALRRRKLANTIHIARDGAEALEFLFQRPPFADTLNSRSSLLILLDLKLPKVSGLEVLARIKGDPKMHSIPIVVLTSSREDVDIARCYELGVNSYIVKPVDFEQFVEAVGTVGIYWLLINQPPVAHS
jgi:CheY-like chemotaxis protein